VQGTFYVDADDDVYYCTAGGTPGTWKFWGWKAVVEGGAANGSSYTGAIAAGASADLVVTNTKGRRGIIRKFNVWGSDSVYGISDESIPFRVACYQDENYEGREMMWMVQDVARKTNTSGVAAGNAVIPVTTVNIADPDSLLRLRQIAGPLEEYGRVTVRTPGGPSYTVDENIANTLAANDIVMSVTEFGDLPWYNNSSVGVNYEKVYLRFFNDHATATVVFGYEIYFECVGGGNVY